MAGRLGAGRRRTQIRRIPRANARRVALSKRRSSLFKKASELCTLCAVEAAIVLFSPGGKAFSFGHPSVGVVVNRVANFGSSVSDSNQNAPDDNEATLHELRKRYSELLQELGAEKKCGDELKQIRMKRQRERVLTIRTLDELSVEELMTLKSTLDAVLEKVMKRLEELSVEAVSPTPTSARGSDASIVDTYGYGD